LGQNIVFESSATNLVPNDTNGAHDIFMKNVMSGAIARVSVSSTGKEADGSSFDPAISSDAHFVVYSSDATNLVANDVNGLRDVFMFDTMTGTTTIQSVGPAGQGNGDSNHPKVSTDPVVAFDSVATNLIAADGNGAVSDVFARVVFNGTTRLVSMDSFGVQGNDASTFPDITPSSSVFAFQSKATNLVPGDINGVEDVFTHRSTGVTRRVSIATNNMAGNGDSGRPDLNVTGQLVAFHSDATNLVANDLNNRRDVFLRNGAAGTTRIVSLGGAGQGNGDSQNPSITPSGAMVAFESVATNLVAGDTNAARDVFMRQVVAAVTSRISVRTGGLQANGPSTTPAASENAAGAPRVAYDSVATNLVAADANGASDIFQSKP
jgi:hypothetical protein